jgi:hypothetical protein
VIPVAPAVYADDGSDAVISVDGELLISLSQQVQTMLDGINQDVTTIFTTLNGLALGWAGQTATEAQDFFDRLDACMTVLYGKDGDQTSEQNSMLGRVSVALDLAGTNYLQAEDAIVSLFTVSGSVSDTNLKQHGSGTPGTTDITDPTFTSVAETF